VTQCPSDGSTCTRDECDPDRGCVYPRRPNGAECALPGSDWLCCIFCFGFDCSCCHVGVCREGVCIEN
jgi:hypothetical protein